jgi:citryl-CoA lyase
VSTNSRGRQLGGYYRSGDWSDYWTTAVSQVGPHKLLLRGYPIDEVITRLSFPEVVYLTIRGELPTPSQARVLGAALSSIPAHQWVAAHLLVAAVTASASPESPIPGIASGILAMGSVTVSPQSTAELLDRARAHMAEDDLTMSAAAERVVDEFRAEGKLIPGLGHPTTRTTTRALRRWPGSRARKGSGRGLRALLGGPCGVQPQDRQIVADQHRRHARLRAARARLLAARDGRCPAIAAMPGIVAHVIEEIERGVPLRIVPEELGSRYVGPAERHVPQASAE